MQTVVFQSHRQTGRPDWIDLCLCSVREWADKQGYTYRFLGDELLERVPEWFSAKAAGRRQIVADLGRLLVTREFLEEEADQVIWLDADTLVFAPASLDLQFSGDPGYAFGLEVWIQENARGELRAHRNVHNAICLFQRGNAFLDFYIHACLSIMRRVDGGVPPQIIGPKFLTAQYNILGFPLIKSVGAFSPLVLRDIHSGEGAALELLCSESPIVPAAANLCASLITNESDMLEICEILLSDSSPFRHQKLKP